MNGPLKICRKSKQSGLTLVELLVSIAIFSIIVGALYQVVGHTFSAYQDTRSKQNLLIQARYAVERMVMFVQESDEIVRPDALPSNELTLSERVLDTFDNLTHAYQVDGDGKLDADNDADGLVNEGADDTAEYISFKLDKRVADNWKLIEKQPDYSTEDINDQTGGQVICEHVADFTCRRFDSDMVEIKLRLEEGKHQVSLKTRAKARHMK